MQMRTVSSVFNFVLMKTFSGKYFTIFDTLVDAMN